MKTKIDWKNHLIELVVVFVGITAAFALENWGNYSAEREMELKYLSGFLTDTNVNIDSLNAIISSKQSALDLADKGQDLIKKGNFSMDSLALLLQNMSTIETSSPRRISYESLMNSGGLETITNFELRNMIVEVNNTFDAVKLADDTHVYFIKEYIVPYFFNNIYVNSFDIIQKSNKEQKRFRNIVMIF